ncbi:family 1 glycosylhydrolase [Demequina aestuarii]|uniref:family 1 glycosylhydrolase n=1 Tax=Demequina aestuarii TaxID=327095 RepID=UPI0007866DAF|nr:family 1 glycosylhydrolase [Demequina aestuarii]
MSAWHRDGTFHMAVGIEDTFVPQGRPGERPIDEYELTEHYGQVESDFALAADVGAGLVRWGVPWYRIQPERDSWDFDWLDRAMDAFGASGLTPLVDLMHYGTPLWLDGQFDNDDYPSRVAEYGARVAERYAHLGVTSYTPVNEPMIHALFSGEYAYWPPYLAGEAGLSRMVKQVALGFQETQRAIAAVLGESAVFVHVDAGMRYTGDVDAPEHAEHVRRLQGQVHLVEDLVVGTVDERHPLHPLLAANGWSEADFAAFADRPTPPDVMGINYYPRHSTEVFERGVFHTGGFADPRPCDDAGVRGLDEVVRNAAARFGVPVMVTETCVTGTVAERVQWLRESVAWALDARRTGLDLVGYTWWPLFDMYEWTWRHSDRPREAHRLTMGLWELVEAPEGLLRRETDVARVFREIAASVRDDDTIRRSMNQ